MTNPNHNHYTDEQRIEAVKLALEIGASPAAKQLKIPYYNVFAWTRKSHIVKEATKSPTPTVVLRKGSNVVATTPTSPASELANLENYYEEKVLPPLKEQIRGLREDYNQVSREMHKSLKDNKSLQQEIVQLKNDKNELISQLEDVNLEFLKNDYSEAKERIKELTTEMTSLQEAHKVLGEGYDRLYKEYMEQKEVLKTVEDRAKELFEINERITSTRAKQDDDFSTRRIAELENKLSALTGAHAQLKYEYANLEVRHDSSRIAQLEEQLNSLLAQRDDLTTDYVALKEAHKDLNIKYNHVREVAEETVDDKRDAQYHRMVDLEEEVKILKVLALRYLKH